MSDVDDDTGAAGPDARITRAVKFMRRVEQVDSINRKNAEEWRKFRDGDQWPAEIQNQRQLERRPCITVNKTDAYCQKVENQQRQQRPRIKVDPTGGRASKRDADVIKGMVRHIEATDGGADMAYDTGFSSAVTEGRGYWRVLSRYVSEDSFEQELYLQQIDDQLTVYFDPDSIMPDGSDAEECLIVSTMNREAFKEQYPDANDGANFQAAGNFAGWVTREQIRVAEHIYIDREKATLCRLSNGTRAWKDDLPPAEELGAQGLTVVDERPSMRKKVEWCKLTAMDVLDERTLPGKYLRVIPTYGRCTIIDGKRQYSGLVKNAVGPQTMSNFWKTAMTESVALAPKAKWVIAEGQDEDHVNEWAQANQSATSVLRYKPTTIGDQPAPPPQRQQPEGPPEGAMAMAQAADQDLSAVLGIIEPAMRIRGNVSGKALQAERLQSDDNTFNFYDNMTRSIALTGRTIVDLLPYYYPEGERVVRIIGDDGKSKTQPINVRQQYQNAAGQQAERVLHDMSVRQYEIVMDTGPGYNTKRQEAVDSMMPLFEKDPELMKVAGDVMFRNMDFPGADTIADRLAAANPLSQIDEDSDVPPAAQTMIKGLQQKLQAAGQQIQQLSLEIKFRADIESMREAAASHRTTIVEDAKTQRNTDDNRAWMHDVATKAASHIGGKEIDAAAKVITAEQGQRHDLEQIDRVADREDRQLAAQADRNPA